MFSYGFIVVHNLRASIIHSDRLSGYILRSWPVTEKTEVVSRGIFNTIGGKLSADCSWDEVEQGRHALEVVNNERRVR